MPEVAVGQTLYDLTQAGSLLVDQTDFLTGTPSAVAGSGSFGPMVRLQNNGSEQGYNSGGSPVMADVKNGIHFRFANFRAPANPGGTVNGVAYHSFALELNEGSGGESPSLHADRSSTSPKVYDLDASGDKSLFFDGSFVDSGSSPIHGDMLVPQSVFAPDAGSANNVFMYFQMGAIGTSGGRSWNTEGGSEDWNAVSGLTFTIAQPVPEPGTVGAAAAVIAVSGWSWYSRKRKRNRTTGSASQTPSPAENGDCALTSESQVVSAQA
jgi:hypothetical protein